MTAAFAIFLPLLVAYAMALQWCADRWNAPTMYFQHCWLVPVIGALVVWSRRLRWRTQPAWCDRRA